MKSKDSTMTDINEYLAREVMGGQIYNPGHKWSPQKYWKFSDGSMVEFHKWRPTERIEQAIECAKELPEFKGFQLLVSSWWDSRHTNPKRWLGLIYCRAEAHEGKADTEAAALSEAVARAAGMKT